MEPTSPVTIVSMTADRTLKGLQSPNGVKVIIEGKPFRIIQEDSLQGMCNHAERHGRNGGMLVKEW